MQTKAAAAEAAAAAGSAPPSQRARVFVQMITDLKNNKQRASERDGAGVEQGALLKWLRRLATQGREPPPFKAGWDELRDADTKGRWWLTGAAWVGRQAGAADAPAAASSSADGAGEGALLKLAGAQRMNTEVRRALFVAIMGADDYKEAHSRVGALRLKKAQLPEVARVLLDCCAREGAFNPFYALLGAELCASREVRYSLQCAYWDSFKQLAELSLPRAANQAKLLARLVSRGALPIGVLKVVGWHGQPPRAVFHWQVFFLELLAAPADALRAALLPLADGALASLRDGVLLFATRHLGALVSKSHPALAGALGELTGFLASTAPLVS